MAFKKKESPQVDKTVAKAVNFEVSVSELARRSEKRAWIVAMFALIVGLCMTGVVIYMQPLQKVIPYIVVVDPYSGNSTTSALTPDVFNRIPQMGANETVARANVAQYVISRESFDKGFWELRDWSQVRLMSTPEVWKEYEDFHNPNKNQTAPSKEMGRDRSIRVRILNILPSNRSAPDQQRPGGSADVRIQRYVYDKRSNNERPLDNRIIRIEYVWNTDLAPPDEVRHLNPLGFQVVSYRIDSDFEVGGPPVVPPPDALTRPAQPAAPAYPAGYPQGALPDAGYPQQYPGGPTDPTQQAPVQPGQVPQQFPPTQPGQFPPQAPAQPGQLPPQQVPAQGQFPPQQSVPATQRPPSGGPQQGAAPGQTAGGGR